MCVSFPELGFLTSKEYFRINPVEYLISSDESDFTDFIMKFEGQMLCLWQ